MSYIFNPQPGAMVEARLYLGASIAGERAVTYEAFNEFLEESVSPRFDGFTVLDAVGYWKGQEESAFVLSILFEDTLSHRHSVRVIAEHYNDRFKQEAVMVQFIPCAFDLVSWPHAGTGYRAGADGNSGKVAEGWVAPENRGAAILDEVADNLRDEEQIIPDPEAPINLAQARDAIATFSRSDLVTVQGHDDLLNHDEGSIHSL